MVLVLSALTSAEFGTGVIMGLALGASMIACVYACREAHRAGVEDRLPRPGPAAKEEQPGRPRGRRSEGGGGSRMLRAEPGDQDWPLGRAQPRG